MPAGSPQLTCSGVHSASSASGFNNMTSACRFLSPGHGVPDVTVGCGGESEGRLSFNERETLSQCDALPNATAKVQKNFRNKTAFRSFRSSDEKFTDIIPYFFLPFVSSPG